MRKKAMSDIMSKPCPSCGGRAETHCENGAFYVGCIDCFMRGPEILEVRAEAEKDAIATWNKLPRHLRWTTEPPTEPGWYWYRLANGESSGDIVRLYDAWCDGRLCVYNGLEKPILLRDFRDGNVEWAGPIPEPQENK